MVQKTFTDVNERGQNSTIIVRVFLTSPFFRLINLFRVEHRKGLNNNDRFDEKNIQLVVGYQQ
jgi:hypothetical protein